MQIKRYWYNREFLIILAFAALTVMMTWPLVFQLRYGVSDAGDPYLHSWMMWWDYHQTFRDPLHLFDANIFFPYRYTLAFSENDYGIALIFFPLFALGFRPITVHSLATLVGFAFSGYGMFRLARTLTGSEAVAWIAGIVFGFIPYRFGQLPHLNYLFAGWIPILLEALVLFIRHRSRRLGMWLGFAFLMNALTCIHWLILTLIPLGLSAACLLVRQNAWRDARLWRGLLPLAIASILLVPFLLPYAKVSRLYGFVRGADELRMFSAQPVNWLVADDRNRTWKGLYAHSGGGEKNLFPGLVPILLALAALCLVKTGIPVSEGRSGDRTLRKSLLALDIAILTFPILGFAVAGFESSHGPWAGLFFSIFTVALVTRLFIAYPLVLRRAAHRNLVQTIVSSPRSDAFWLSLIWMVTGFFGSLGLNFSFHSFLFQFVPLFNGIRVPARWATICYLGLALLSGIGARRFSQLITRYWHNVSSTTVYTIIAIAILFEQRAAPLRLVRGEAVPNELTLRLKHTEMSGGIVELPAGEGSSNMLYVLRAADHAKPLVTAYSGFTPPIERQIEDMTRSRPVPDNFIDLLESIPASYLVVHTSRLTDTLPDIESFLEAAVAAGRIRFIRSYGNRDDLYSVTKTEPGARSEAPIPFRATIPIQDAILERDPSLNNGAPSLTNPIDDTQFFVRTQYQDFLAREPDAKGMTYWSGEIIKCGVSARCIGDQRAAVAAAFFIEPEFQQSGFFLCRLYEATLGRAPSYAEFAADRRTMQTNSDFIAARPLFVATWTNRAGFARFYPAEMSPENFVDALLANVSRASQVDLSPLRQGMIAKLKKTGNRSQTIMDISDNEAFSQAEYNKALVLMQYFGYLKRDADPAGYGFWLDMLNGGTTDNYRGMARVFITSREYRSRFIRAEAGTSNSAGNNAQVNPGRPQPPQP